ncbi:MAG: Proposed peptidoglycan lipid II flippase MurJ [uncultured Campylobacterales bacterium]|uniref:Probable lipid II flippase MurJ n=1 Tax=uncultured Campylobacterales bacterium TaxID=352960 RepID=A0A6S6T585_9BACT|nr:MAG: Proposed peptidoglycan lipid II flippase MurJ [uncultured Campylobacterales bacterium]
MTFIKRFFTNSFGILFSRIFGFLRDLSMASVLGASIYTDMFFVAFKFPNLFRRIFAEGAFTQVFMPSFIKSKYKSIFTFLILRRFSIILIIFTLVVIMFSELFTKLIAFGFDNSTIALTASYLRINFLYLILIFIVTLFSSLLQYKNHFATTSFSTSLLNISMISALLIFREYPPSDIVFYLSISVVIGGILQLIAHLIALKYKKLLKLFTIGFKAKKYKAKVSKNLKEFNKSFLPAILGNSTAQVSAFLDTWLASFLSAGSISYMFYSNRIFQLPLALFAIALSVAIFPKIAKLINKKQIPEALTLLRKSFWFLLYLLTIATVGGIILSNEIVTLLFTRGAFSSTDALNTSNVLIMYMIGLIPYGISKIFLLWIYAHHNQKQAAKIAMYSLVSNVLLSVVLVLYMDVMGLALASSIAGIVLIFYILIHFGLRRFASFWDSKKFIILVVIISLEIGLLLLAKPYITDLLQ